MKISGGNLFDKKEVPYSTVISKLKGVSTLLNPMEVRRVPVTT